MTGGGAHRPRLPSAFAFEVAWRFLRGSRRQLVGTTARAALGATALGVVAMVIAMALMTGYREDLQRKLVGGNAAVVAYPLVGEGAPAEPEAGTIESISAIPGVRSVRRVAFGQGTLLTARNPEGVAVTLRGVDPGEEALGDGTPALPLPAASPSEADLEAILLGAELAESLGVVKGDVVRLTALGFRDGRPRFAFHSLRVEGTFRTGLSEFDREWAALRRDRVRLLTAGGGEPSAASTVLEIRLDRDAEAPATADLVREVLGSSWLVSDWESLNAELFTALRVQQAMLFLVLGLIVVVSTFNVSSSLVVLVRERLRDLGVLAALGFSPQGLRRAFVAYGVLLGTAGTILGLVIGVSVAWALDTFRVIRFSAEVAAIYFLDAVPFRVRPLDAAAVGGFALAVNLLACWAPAARAARVDPVEALRYE